MSMFMKYLRPDGKWQCCAPVQKPHIWKPVRCERIATINDCWCKQHDPVAIAARKERTRKDAHEKWERRVKQMFAGQMFSALSDIATKRRRDVKASDIAKEIIDQIKERIG